MLVKDEEDSTVYGWALLLAGSLHSSKVSQLASSDGLWVLIILCMLPLTLLDSGLSLYTTMPGTERMASHITDMKADQHAGAVWSVSFPSVTSLKNISLHRLDGRRVAGLSGRQQTLWIFRGPTDRKTQDQSMEQTIQKQSMGWIAV